MQTCSFQVQAYLSMCDLLVDTRHLRIEIDLHPKNNTSGKFLFTSRKHPCSPEEARAEFMEVTLMSFFLTMHKYKESVESSGNIQKLSPVFHFCSTDLNLS